jgi:NADPH-dependent 2,4-dienoyl-CoA reductase/sulfur reductase-like enzyme
MSLSHERALLNNGPAADCPIPMNRARSSMLSNADIMIVGAGFYGAILAERIASKLGRRVLLIDRRNHVGGNAYSETDPRSVQHLR